MSNNNVTPYEVGDLRSSNPPRHIDYIAMDYEAMKRRAVQFIIEQFPNDFNNFSESDFGIFLLELWAFIMDHVSFKIDYAVNKMTLDGADDLESIMRLAQLIGYHPQPPTASKAWISASLLEAQADDVIIPAGYVINAAGEDGTIPFELHPANSAGEPIFDQNIVIPAGTIANTNIVAIQGSSRSQTLTSDGNANQSFITLYNPVIFGSLEVLVDGEVWTPVESFPLGTGSHYKVDHNSDYSARITFGDNVYGLIPPDGAQITLNYRIGGGSTGNVVRGSITESSSFDFRNDDGAASVSITNYDAAAGGSDGDTVEDIRRKMPISVRTQERLVSGEDYRNYAEGYSSDYHGRVGKATAILRQFGCAANVIDIYILQDDGGQDLVDPTPELREELIDSIDQIKMMTDSICVKSGEIIQQSIAIGVLSSRTYLREKAGIERNIRDRLDTFFRLSNWSFGRPLRKGELLRYLAGIPEITSLDVVLESNAADLDPDPDIVEVAPYQIIRPGEIEISFTFE